jgi:hypothetical protein
VSAKAESFYLPAGAERPAVVARVHRTLDRLDATRRWTVTIAEHKPARTDAQNRYLWGVVYATILREAATHLQGFTAQDLHEWFLGAHFGWEVIEGFGAKRRRPMRRSSRLNKQEFSDFVAFIQRECAERFGIVIADASEHMGDG